ncbi:MAG: hypothetical protein K2I37_00100 [Muribaculaceae bacterium]|nr:hypothetical protein [Muribaculaceae bacterium]
MRYLLLLFASILAVIGVQSCISDDFTTSPSVRLRFSTDTVTFDTVFTNLGTPTARLKVYNPDKKGVSISSIRFADSETEFSMNVDGVSGTDFHDVEIRGGDSIFIFIECYIPESRQDEPFLVEDKILFSTNGTEQSVQVEAYGQNVTRLRNVEVTADMTLTADRPYVVFDSLTVRPGATLHVEPGTKLLFHDKASLVVEGRLEAVGEPGKLIDLRGDRLDKVLPDVGYDIMAGQWKGVRIAAGSFDNRMEYCNMRSTTDGLRIDSTADLTRQKLTLVNSWLHNSQSTVLSSLYAKVDAYGCIFSEAAGAVVKLTGGLHDFSQCTLANYYLFSVIYEPLLTLHHLFPEDNITGNPNPLMRATFSNSIIYGLASDINEGDLADSEVYLRYVSMKAAGSDDANFINCLWDCDPQFETIREDYYFNYRLKPDSPVIGAGDASLTAPPTLTDIDGLRRATPPALGAYSFRPAQE